ncbi:hypothetical protein NPX13_g9535 [Xylaria arbuscula]|uniref:CFEM domain-containing protein n=1 Tax=Xylaria arbuscula TaxID=114810 RepID=A0A9W8N681_9PEZI|nr:hypothetical protein NPX13_g9535 [Xylaria arbuscula]
MQFKVAALSVFAAAAAAQNSTSLPDLVSQLPTCAIPCFESGAEAAGCSTTDFDCLCGDGKDTFISSAGTCVLSKCDSEDFSTAVKVAPEICTEVTTGDPDPSEVASASAIVTSALSAADATSTADADSAAYRPEIGLTFMGAMAALLAL